MKNTKNKRISNKNATPKTTTKKASLFRIVVSYILMYDMMLMNALPALASDISGITPNGNTYNIEAAKVSGSTGFRHYGNFKLDDGDVANLIYKNYSKFVNLVDSQISINGLVNTVNTNGAFYNGHAIFVSPNGMVVGASGVLNVGSLTMATPNKDKFNAMKNAYNGSGLSNYEVGADKYKELLTTSEGNIVINGKIIARGDVEAYGKEITIKGQSGEKAGILAGVQGQNEVFTSKTRAKQVFDNLVSNNITDTTNFSLENGKIKIVAKADEGLASETGDDIGIATAKVEVKDANLGASGIDISAETKMEKVFFDTGLAKVDIENSNITADSINITATTESKSEQNINLIPPVVWAWIFENTQFDENGEIISSPAIDEYFSLENPYTGFAGNRALANINIKNSIMTSVTDDINIKSKAVADLTVSSFSMTNPVSAEAYPQLLYAYGTKTESKVNIDNSKLTAGDELILNAFSNNKMNFGYLNDNALIKIGATDAYNFAMFNTSTIADTIINVINNSTLKASNNVKATALAYTDVYELAKSTVTVGKNDFSSSTQGGSGATFLVQINNTKVDSNVNIKDSTIDAKGDVTLYAQNVNIQKKTLSIATSPKGYKKPEEIQDQAPDTSYHGGTTVWEKIKSRLSQAKGYAQTGGRWVKDKGMAGYKWFDEHRQSTYSNIFKKVFNRAQDNNQNAVEGAANQDFGKAMFQAGGSVLLETIKHNTNVVIDNSTINANILDISALTFDKLSNKVTSSAAAAHGENESAVIGAGIAVIVTKRTNDTNILIQNNSNLSADKINLDTLNELPGNHGTIGIANSYLTLGVAFNGDAKDDWDIKWHDVTDPEGASIVPTFGLYGLFNNFVGASSSGDNFAISASVVYNQLHNNAKISIKDAIVETTYDMNINAVNSVVARDSAGFLSNDSVLNAAGILDIYSTEGGIGTGGVVLIQNINNDAIAEIVGSTVTSYHGDLNLNAASEQSYMNIATNGTQASTLAINGAVNVQNITGNTVAQIKDNKDNGNKKSEISAQNINVNAGKANTFFANSGKQKKDDKSSEKKDDESKTDTTDDKSENTQDESKTDITDDSPEITDKDVLTLQERRDVKDHITNIIVLGTLTSQKADGEGSKVSAAIGASVNAQKIDRTIRATIENAVVTSLLNTSINAKTNVKDISFALSGALANGGTYGAGNAEGLQNIGGAGNIINNGAHGANGNILNGAGNNDNNNIANAVQQAGGAMGSSYTIAAAGAVNSLIDSTKTEATVSGSSLNVGKNLDVTATEESFIIDGAGALGKSGKVGMGAGINLYKQDGHAKALINNNSIINFTENNASQATISALNKSEIYNVGVGIATATDSNSGINAAVGGSFVYNTIKPTIMAEIENAVIDGLNKEENSTTDEVSETKISVTAQGDNKILDVAGGVIATNSGNDSISIGAGIAATVNSFENKIYADVKGSTLKNIKDLDIDAKNKQDTLSVGAALAVNGVNTSTSINFDGSVGVDYFENKVYSQILDSKIDANGNISVDSSSDIENDLYVGVLQASLDGKGLGVNGSVAVNVHENDILAKIDAGNKEISAQNITVGAKSKEKSNIIPVTFAFTGGSAAIVAANVSVDYIKNQINAVVFGDSTSTGNTPITNISAKNNITVAADDETTIYNRGGTLAAASSDSPAVIGGAVNVDNIEKKVSAKIGRGPHTYKDNQNVEHTDTYPKSKVHAGGTIYVSAVSTNSLGGTKKESENNEKDITSQQYQDNLKKKEDGSYSGLNYDRDNITSKDYQDNLMKKDSDGTYSGLNYDNDFKNWNMFYNLSAGANAAISGAIVSKTIDDTITAEVANSTITAKNLNIAARERSVKNVVAGQITASSSAALGVQVLAIKDNSNTSALISNGSDINITETLDISSVNQKDDNQILVAASIGGNAAGGVNFISNKIKDNNTAKIDNSTVKAGKIKMHANEDMNSSKVVVSAAASSTVAVNVSPAINKYEGTTISQIANSTINDASINLASDTDIKTRDISVGVSAAGSGAALTGMAIKNTYDTKTKSVIDSNSIIDTAKDIVLDANSVVNSTNWIVGASFVGTGASLIANVILNDMISSVESSISDSEIKKAGKITLNTNKNKTDELNNYGMGGSVAGEGVGAVVTTIYNLYNNDVVSKIYNTSIESSDSIETGAYSKRDINNVDISLSIAAIGGSGAASALVNEINSTILSYIDAQSKRVETQGLLKVKAQDETFANNKLGFGTAGGLAAAIGASVNLYTSNNLVKAEILSKTDGQIRAGSAEISTQITNGLDNTTVGAAMGVGAIAADVQIIKIGKESNYSESEKDSKVNDAIQKTKESYDAVSDDGRYNPEGSSSKTETGSVARINGNLTTANDTNIKAESKLKGKDGDTLKLKNVAVSGGGTNINVSVRDVQLASNTKAEIAGGTVESTSGNVSVNASSKSDVEIVNTAVDVSILNVTGGSAIYENASNTIASVGSSNTQTNVNAQKDINIVSNSVSNSNIETHHVSVALANVVGVNILENTDINNGTAQITGLTNINAKGKLNVHSTVDTDLKSDNNTVEVQGINAVSVVKNKTEASTIAKAIIENVTGTIKANGIDLITDYNKMSAFAEYDITSVTPLNVASYNSAKTTMNANFTSGIYNLRKEQKTNDSNEPIEGEYEYFVETANGTTIDNSGALTIETAKKLGNNDITAKSELNSTKASLVNFYTGSYAEAENTALSNTYLKVGQNTSNSLKINSTLDSLAKVHTEANSGGLISVNSAGSDAKDTSTVNVDISGKNTIKNNAEINVVHNASTSADIEALDVGIAVSGQRVRINSDMKASTTGNISDDFMAKKSDISFSTTRNSYLSKGTKSGGLINVNDAKAENKISGTSTLNIDIQNTDESLNNANVDNILNIKNTSTNIFDMASTDSSGGVINVSVVNDKSELDTSTITNLNNANIKSKDTVNFEVTNNTIVNDSGSMNGGGFVAVLDSTYDKKYTSGAYLNLKDTEINANDITLKTHSDISSKKDEPFKYKAGGGGFVSVNSIDVTNELTQKSKIDLKNSKLYAQNNTGIEAKTSSRFKQESNNDSRGFVGAPNVTMNLTATYDNTINLDNQSVVSAQNDAIFNFDSNNTLESSVTSEAYGLAAPATGKSYLKLTVNNELNNAGQIKSGNTASIKYMKDSTNNLKNYVHTESTALVASTTEDANLERIVNNKLIVPTRAKVVSDKDIEVIYSSGTGKSDSSMRWDTHSLWGAINDDKTTHPSSTPTNNSLKLDGEMIAGEGNSRYMKINKDGTVDTEATTGFKDGDYKLQGEDMSNGEAIKAQKLASITLKIEDAETDLAEAIAQKTDLENKKTSDETEKTSAQNTINDFNNLVATGYTPVDTRIQGENDTSAYSDIIQNDLKSLIVGTGEKQISAEKYSTFSEKYNNKLIDVNKHNKEQPDNQWNTPTIKEFLDSETSLNLSQAQKDTIVSAYTTVQNNTSSSAQGFSTYTSLAGTKYVGVQNPTEVEGTKTCNEIQKLNARITNLNEQLLDYELRISGYNDEITALGNNITALNNEKTTINNTPAEEFSNSGDRYAITFNNMSGTNSHILLDGIKNGSEFTGNGTISVASSGVKIDNYSTRSLIFNDIDLGLGHQSGLIISGQNFSEFANSEKAVNGSKAYEYKFYSDTLSPLTLALLKALNREAQSDITFDEIGTDGAHYISNSGPDTNDIIINNFYDPANPFAKNQEILNPTLASDIIFNGLLSTGNNFNVFNDSGSIIAQNLNTNNIKGAINLIATKGDVNINTGSGFNLKENDQIFAGNSVSLKAPSVETKGKITAGYNKDLTLTITEDMLSNLTYDPVIGENVLINLGNTPWANASNNIKALYKEGKIYLYNINDTVKGVDRRERGKINIESNSISNTGTITTYDGYQNITVDNQTGKELIISNVINSKSTGGLYQSNKDPIAAQNVKSAYTTISSTGKIVLDGIVRNGVIASNEPAKINSSDGTYTLDTTKKEEDSSGGAYSSLFIQAKDKGLEVNKPSKEADSIFAEGTVIIQNSSDTYSPLNQLLTSNSEKPESDMSIKGDVAVQGDLYIYQDTKGKLSIDSFLHQIEHADNTSGNLFIQNMNSNAGGVTTSDNSIIFNEKGDIWITNQSEAEMKLGGGRWAPSGEICVYNSGGRIEDNTETIGESILFANVGDTPITINGTNIATDGDITVMNAYGDLTVSETGRLINMSSGDRKIDITNTTGGQKLIIAGQVENWSDGDIEIKNKGAGDAEISGSLYAYSGNIKIDNEQNNLNISGTIETNNGSVTIINHGEDVNIGHIDSNNPENSQKADLIIKNGNLSIDNGAESSADDGSSMSIYASIRNYTDGLISITNGENSGGMTIKDTDITMFGAGSNVGSDIIAMIIDNNSTSAGLTIDNSNIVTLDGNIIINNRANYLTLKDGLITSVEDGDIKISNTGNELSILNYIKNEKGNTIIENTGNFLDISGNIENTGGDIQISNENGSTNIANTIFNRDGNIEITSGGAEGMDIRGSILNTGGYITVSNTEGDFITSEGSQIRNYADSQSDNQQNSITITNTGYDLQLNGIISNQEADINITNEGEGKAVIAGLVENTGEQRGEINVKNTSDNGLKVETNGVIHNTIGNIVLENVNTPNGTGMDIEGIIKTDTKDIQIKNTGADLRIGEYTSANDNYINAITGNVIINQNGGNILNNIVDPDTNATHQNADLGNPNQAYKTLIATGGDLVINAKDGNIGATSNPNAGYSISADTRDYTESLNVSVGGGLIAKAINEAHTDKRLINIRAKDSDLTLKDIETNGNIILTATDWKQADTRPTPDNDNYFRGYNILTASNDNIPVLYGQNISLIASNGIGTEAKPVIIEQDTLDAPNSSISAEAENDLYITGGSNSTNDMKIYQMISKHGTIGLGMTSNADIAEITSGGGIKLTQKAQNLTIRSLGLFSAGPNFDDILYPHDDIKLTDEEMTPKYAIIKVLDAKDTPERSDSNLKIYSGYVRGNNGDNAKYYPNGTRLADYTLMADNIYANSDKAQNSSVSTLSNPSGYKQTKTTWTEAEFGGTGTTVHTARGLNVLGNGGDVSLDVLGVDKNDVDALGLNAQRQNYVEQTSIISPAKFANPDNKMKFYGKANIAKTVSISVNDYVNTSRGVVFDTLYAHDAYINTKGTNLSAGDAYITNYAEFQNGYGRKVVVDNDFRRLVPSTVQLYTARTGSFGMSIGNLIKLHTTAPVVHYEKDKLVNTYNDENSFVRLGLKETELRQRTKDYYNLQNIYVMPQKSVMKYVVLNDKGISSSAKILEMSRQGATIANRDNLKVGDKQEIEVEIDGTRAKIKCVVTKIEGDYATVSFVDIPAGLANKLTYHYMQTAQN